MPATIDLRGRSILVTGGTGFVGSALCRRLLAAGAEVHVPTTARIPDPGRLAGLGPALQVHPGIDLADSVAVSHLLTTCAPNAVVHLGAYGVVQREDDLRRMVRVNVEGTANLLLATLDVGTARVVHVGTGLEYAAGGTITEASPLRPTTAYGATKAAASVLVRNHVDRTDAPVVIVRPFAAYGPREDPAKFVPHVILGALANRPVEMSTGTFRREYLHVDDVAEALTLAVVRPLPPGTEVNVSSGEPVRLVDLARQVIDLVGSTSTLRAGSHQPPRLDQDDITTDISVAAEVLGWRPATQLEEGLRKTVEWFRETVAGAATA